MDKTSQNKNFPKSDSNLFEKVMFRIALEEKKAARRRVIFFTGTFIVSLAALLPAFDLLRNNLAISGFWDYLSLLFSDFDVIAVYWQNFLMSLLEVLPVMSLALFLTVVFIILGSLKFLAAALPAAGLKLKINQSYVL